MGSLLKKLRQRATRAGSSRGADKSRDIATEIDERVNPLLPQIVPIMQGGAIAAVVLTDKLRVTRRAARDLGWDGVSTVFAVPAAGARRFAARIRVQCPNDEGFVSWLESTDPGRLMVFLERGGFVAVNYDPEEGMISVQPIPAVGWMN